MPPVDKNMKAKQAAAAKKIEDKTFGMKNKNKCARLARAQKPCAHAVWHFYHHSTRAL